MRYCRVTCFVEGEVIAEPEVPAFCLPFLRWVCRLLGASMTAGPIRDSRNV